MRLAYLTIGEGLKAVRDRFPTRPVLRYKERKEGQYESVNWETFYEEMKSVGRALIACGLEKGDCISILSENRKEWMLVDLAAISIGLVNAPIFSGDNYRDVCYKLNDSASKVLFLSDQTQLDKIADIEDDLPRLREIVAFEDVGANLRVRPAGQTHRSAPTPFAEFCKRGEGVEDAELEARMNAVETDDPAMVI